MTEEKTELATAFKEIVRQRRSMRVYDNQADYDTDRVTECAKTATLSPNSSNMQLWEFYHVVSPEKKRKLAELCMNQNAAKTAGSLMVIVARPDLWKKRKEHNLENMKKRFPDHSENRAKRAFDYYRKLIPFFYSSDRLGIINRGKRVMAWFMGLRKPMFRELRRSDIRVTVHKSAALAAMTFMYAMKSEGYDTCPMEGFDSKRVKKLLGLPNRSEINMVVGCGVGTPEGIYDERRRVPHDEVIFNV
ncbi:nitroreductase [Fulvitalea axinellae]|uniref:Nitroreductase n=1 Tax=Fulvitalea axinellae TaxID=1182444 RepID=A0AAU9CXS9_9BACT|nr:nitroreductase [Fulvitalea axinellae]